MFTHFWGNPVKILTFICSPPKLSKAVPNPRQATTTTTTRAEITTDWDTTTEDDDWSTTASSSVSSLGSTLEVESPEEFGISEEPFEWPLPLQGAGNATDMKEDKAELEARFIILTAEEMLK